MKEVINNEMRVFFGLNPMITTYDVLKLEDHVLYFMNDVLHKILVHQDDTYIEIDTNVVCEDKKYIVPTTSKGNKQKLTVTLLRKKKYQGMKVVIRIDKQTIEICNKQNHQSICIPFTHKLTKLEQVMDHFQDLQTLAPSNWEWMLNQIKTAPKKTVKYKNGDVFRVAIDWNHFAYGIVIGKFSDYRKQGLIQELHPFDSIMGVPVVVRIYDFISSNPQLDLETIDTYPLQSPIIVADDSILHNEHPIMFHRSLKTSDIMFPIFYEILYLSNNLNSNNICFSVDDNNELQDLLEYGYRPRLSLSWGFAMITKNEEDLSNNLPPLDNFFELSNTGVGILYLENVNNKPYYTYDDFINNQNITKVFQYFGVDPNISFDAFNEKYGGYTRVQYVDMINKG